MGGHDRNAETAQTVSLYREAALVVHTLEYGLYLGTGLHELVAGEVTDITGTYCQDVLSQKGELRVHHLLDDSRGVYAGKVVILESRHERNRTGCDYQGAGLHIEGFTGLYVLDHQPSVFKDITYGRIQEYAAVILSGKVCGDIETTLVTESLLFLEEEEAVGLHQELTSDLCVGIHHDAVDSEFAESLTAGKSGRTGADDGHIRDIYLRSRLRELDPGIGIVAACLDFSDFAHVIDLGHTDTLNFPVHKHLAGAALAYTAVHRTVAPVDTVAVHRKSCLMESRGYGLSSGSLDLNTVVDKTGLFSFRNMKNRMVSDFTHCDFLLK